MPALPFDGRDPFPLVDSEAYTRTELAEHAGAVDAWLGLRAENTERELYRREVLDRAPESSPDDGQELWLGLSVQSLLTPYAEIRHLLHRLGVASGERMVDLGAAYGRMAFVAAREFPGLEFLGYEYVEARIAEGRRCLRAHGLAPEQLQRADLRDPAFVPADADYYFTYDFGSRAAIAKILGDLCAIALRRPITVIGRGRATQEIIEREHAWLCTARMPAHFANYSIYRSRAP